MWHHGKRKSLEFIINVVARLISLSRFPGIVRITSPRVWMITVTESIFRSKLNVSTCSQQKIKRFKPKYICANVGVCVSGQQLVQNKTLCVCTHNGKNKMGEEKTLTKKCVSYHSSVGTNRLFPQSSFQEVHFTAQPLCVTPGWPGRMFTLVHLHFCSPFTPHSVTKQQQTLFIPFGRKAVFFHSYTYITCSGSGCRPTGGDKKLHCQVFLAFHMFS